MSKTKEYFIDYLSSEDFDLMYDDEYELWLQQQQNKKEQYEAERDAYEEALAAAK